LRSDETILIHGAAGGVGLAAIQIAKSIGARIIGTAGTPVKRDLLDSLGVDHVLDSRSLKFADEVVEITKGEKVDVVLNSLAGEAMQLSLGCLRPFGRFLELGKQDFYLNSTIGMRSLKENISYFSIDADQIMAAKPVFVARLFREIIEGFERGDLTPLPFRNYQGHQVVDAFRSMQRSSHIGKIVVEPSPVSVELPVEDKEHFTIQ